MKLLFVTLIAFFGLSLAFQPTDEDTSKFEQWCDQFGKSFEDNHEYLKRMAIFLENDQYINTVNGKELDYKLGHNEYSHMTYDEFASQMFGYGNVPQKDWSSGYADFKNVTSVPDSIDWTTKGAVTPVKNQGQCGSCWSFSTTGGLEGAFFLKEGKLISFSEQELVDCDHNGDQGCNGGLMDNAFGWIKKNGGLCTEESYPYHAAASTCRSSSCRTVPGSAPTKWTDVAKNEKALMAAVAQQPVSIAIQANQLGFQLYHSGVFTGNCGTQLDHGVLVVGYGTENGQDYWKVKNSWGATWGDAGYIKIERGKSQNGGQCGILLSASFPTL